MFVSIFRAYQDAPTLLRRSIALFAVTIFACSLLTPLTQTKADELPAPTATVDQLVVKPSEALAAIKTVEGLLAESSEVKGATTVASALQTTTSTTAEDGSSSTSSLTIPRDPTEAVRLDSVINTVTTTQPEAPATESIDPETGEVVVTQPAPTEPTVTTTTTTNSTVLITLPNGVDAAGGRIISNGLVTYAGANGSANAVQATNGGGMRMITVIDTPVAPTQYSYGVTVPTGGKVVIAEDGSAQVQDNGGNVITNIGMPWAKDAKGIMIPTRFTTDGLTLTQTIDHNVAGITYPIVADPLFSKVFHSIMECSGATAIAAAARSGGVKYLMSKDGTKYLAKKIGPKYVPYLGGALCGVSIYANFAE